MFCAVPAVVIVIVSIIVIIIRFLRSFRLFFCLRLFFRCLLLCSRRLFFFCCILFCSRRLLFFLQNILWSQFFYRRLFNLFFSDLCFFYRIFVRASALLPVVLFLHKNIPILSDSFYLYAKIIVSISMHTIIAQNGNMSRSFYSA